MNEKTQIQSVSHLKRYEVHRLLAHSYSIYFVFLLVGIILDLVFRLEILHTAVTKPIGLGFLVFASILILWAQRTSHTLHRENLSKESFCRGPYCYTRSPTHWGLFFLLFGFSLVANAFFIALSTILSFILTKFSFVRKQEAALERKYGAPYLEYKKSVKF